MRWMSACWTRCSGILNWSNFCAVVSVGGIYPRTRNRYKYICGCRWFHNLHWQHSDRRVFVAHFVVCVLACTVQMCDKTYMEKDCTCASIRQACLKARGFTTQPYTCITHLAEGYTSRFKVSLNISLSQMQLQKPQNTPIMVRTDCFSMPCEVRPINWENEHDWGLSTWAGKGQSRW